LKRKRNVAGDERFGTCSTEEFRFRLGGWEHKREGRQREQRIS